MHASNEQSFGLPPGETEERGWYYPRPYFEDLLVYRAAEFGRPMLGAWEISATSPGGQLWIREAAFVNAGETLRAR